MKQVIDTLAAADRSVRGIDAQTYKILTGFIRLFEMFIDCRYYPWRENPTQAELNKIIEKRNPWFSPFYKLCCGMKGYFERKAQMQPSASERPVSDEVSDDDEDGEPVSAIRHRLRATT
jgi:hypothetical protein